LTELQSDAVEGRLEIFGLQRQCHDLRGAGAHRLEQQSGIALGTDQRQHRLSDEDAGQSLQTVEVDDAGHQNDEQVSSVRENAAVGEQAV
jgi:hypothetical protein